MIGNPMGNVFGNPMGNPLGLQRAGADISTAPVKTDALFTAPGVYDWVVPKGVYSICAVCIGTGGGASNGTRAGGGGGAVAYKNNIPVSPGQTLRITVGALSTTSGVAGGNTFIADATTPGVMLVGAGGGGTAVNTLGASGGVVLVGAGGTAGGRGANSALAGSGGAGGYVGAAGGDGAGTTGTGASGGVSSASGGAGNSSAGGGWGGGQWLYGTEGWSAVPLPGGASGNGDLGSTSGRPSAGFGIFFGAGGYDGSIRTNGASGAARILWGEGRAFPATNVGLNL